MKDKGITRSNQPPTMANDMFQEIIQDILSRLPTKSLVRFMSVHKSWLDLIKSPDFIATQLSRSAGNDTPGLVIVCDCDHQYCCLRNRRVLEVSKDTYEVSREIMLPNGIPSCFRLVDSCNGVISLTDSFSEANNYLLNPAIKEFKKLPPRPQDWRHFFRDPQQPVFVGLGFGFDPTSHDYKLVRIYDSFRDPTWRQLYSKVDIYKSSTDSWRRMENLVDGAMTDEFFRAVRVNLFLHWKAVKKIEAQRRQFILRFDLVSDAFDDVTLPGDFHREDRMASNWHPLQFKDLLSVVVCLGPISNRSFDIWVMNECGNEESWAKQLTIEPQLGIERVINCGTNGELLLQDKRSRLIVYDPMQRVILKRLQFYGRKQPTEVINYQESIVAFTASKLLWRSFCPQFFYLLFFVLILYLITLL